MAWLPPHNAVQIGNRSIVLTGLVNFYKTTSMSSDSPSVSPLGSRVDGPPLHACVLSTGTWFSHKETGPAGGVLKPHRAQAPPVGHAALHEGAGKPPHIKRRTSERIVYSEHRGAFTYPRDGFLLAAMPHGRRTDRASPAFILDITIISGRFHCSFAGAVASALIPQNAPKGTLG